MSRFGVAMPQNIRAGDLFCFQNLQSIWVALYCISDVGI